MVARITLPNDRSSFFDLRAFAEGFAAREGLSDVMGNRLVLILEELFTNVHKFGRGDHSAKVIDVGLERVGDDLLVAFADDGGAFNPLGLPIPRMDRNVDERPVGGLGFHIVRSMTRKLRYERTGSWNRLHLVCAVRP